MLAVKLCRQIVYQKHASPAASDCKNPRLSHFHGTDHQFLLPPGKDFIRALPMKTKPDIGAVGATYREASLTIPIVLIAENLQQAALLVPTTLIGKLDSLNIGQISERGRELRVKSLEILPAEPIKPFSTG